MRLGASLLRASLALGVIFFLFALALLITIPHTWHKEDGGARSCAICQAYAMPAQLASAALEIKPPLVARSQPPACSILFEPAALPFAYLCRAPPL